MPRLVTIEEMQKALHETNKLSDAATLLGLETFELHYLWNFYHTDTETIDKMRQRTLFDEPKYALVLNGPPGIGKDTLTDLFIKRNTYWNKETFKEVLYFMTADAIKEDREAFKRRATDREQKDLLYPGRHFTPREAMIEVAELVVKPKYGDDFFGRMAGQIAASRGNYAIFEGAGFPEEVAALLDYFTEVLVVRLHRPGFNFDNDSRQYLYSAYHPSGRIYFDDIQLFDNDPLSAVLALEELADNLVHGDYYE